MKNKFLIVICLLTLIPATTWSAFDFVVDKAVTISNPGAVEGQTVKLYTVVVNNDFTTFSGKVNFYNGGQLIGSTEIKKLALEEARQVFISYVLPAGSLAITTQLAAVSVINKNGEIQNISENDVKNNNPPAIFEIDGDNDRDGIGNKTDPDDDNDGVNDLRESELGTDPFKTDTDGDGLVDQEEIDKKTDPTKADTDGDGVNDKLDFFPIDSKETVDSDHDGIGDNADPDDDNDGLPDDKEKVIGSNPLKADTDGDTVKDGEDALPLDIKENKDTDNDKIGDSVDPDDDNDKISDEEEKEIGTDSTKFDTDGDGATDYEEKMAGTDPKISDKSEVEKSFGFLKSGSVGKWYQLFFDKKWKQTTWLVGGAFLFGWIVGRRQEY